MHFGSVTHALYDIPVTVALVALGVRLILGCIFVVSGTGKLWDIPGTRQALSDFGIPDALTHQAAKAFPVLELLVGVGLFFDASYRLSAIGACALSALFVLGISNLLRQERTPPCHCFGAVQSAPVGYDTLTRAIFLTALSSVCAFGSPSTLTPSFVAHFAASGLILLVISGTSNVALWKKLHPQHKSPKDLGLGQRLPALRLLDGKWLSSTLSPQIHNLIVVTAPGCGPCKELKTHLDRWRATVRENLRILEIEASHKRPEDELVPTDGKHYIAQESLGSLTSGTPSALLVDDRGILLSPPAIGPDQVEALIRVTLRNLSADHNQTT